MSLANIPVGQIKPNPNQPRQHFDEVKLQELADSMKLEGQLEPIGVEPNGQGYILQFGERRWRAAQINEWDTIAAIIHEPRGETSRLVRALVENIQRENMNPVEEAKAYAVLSDSGLSWSEVSKRTGKSMTHIKARRVLLELDEPIQQMVAEGRLPRDRRVADALLSLPDMVRVKMALRMDGMSIEGIVTAVAVYNSRKEVKGPGVYKNAKPERKPASSSYIIEIVAGDFPANLAAAAEQTCQSCVLFQEPMSVSCHECPAVRLARILVKSVEGRASGEGRAHV